MRGHQIWFLHRIDFKILKTIVFLLDTERKISFLIVF